MKFSFAKILQVNSYIRRTYVLSCKIFGKENFINLHKKIRNCRELIFKKSKKFVIQTGIFVARRKTMGFLMLGDTDVKRKSIYHNIFSMNSFSITLTIGKIN